MASAQRHAGRVTAGVAVGSADPSDSGVRSAAPLPLQKIAGFESTDYASLHGRIVWAGAQARTDHPRNAWRPWLADDRRFDAQGLQRGATLAMGLLARLHGSGLSDSGLHPSGLHPDGPTSNGLLAWLARGTLPFPLGLTAPRFAAVRAALLANDEPAFEAAAPGLLGLGPGLTPSGDDFIGAIFFALAHAPRAHWQPHLPALQARMRSAAASATNVISAALLDDLMAGRSYRCLHELLAALEGDDPALIETSARALLRIGASSGADMLAGLLLALSTWHESF